MKTVVAGTGVPIKVWASDLESEAEEQVRNLAALPFIYKHVAVLPDAHAGRGSTVGTVIATKGAIIPAAVGVDIGCGMAAVMLPFTVDMLGGDEQIRALRHSIERSVPVGMYKNKSISETAAASFLALGQPTAKLRDGVWANAALQVGTLGGGNHFIEVCQDNSGTAWLMLHSGSRNIGKCLAETHISRAKDLMKEYFISLPDPDLAYLAQGTPEFEAYIKDLFWGQAFARANRNEMVLKSIAAISYHVYKDFRLVADLAEQKLFRVDCHHNYTGLENHFGSNVWVTRKGAVSAKAGEWGIIPGSMGTKSYIVQGLGNPESFNSCSHGAGRKMSRTKAKALFSTKDLIEQTAGVECRKDADVVDEIPGAYKSIEDVMSNQADLVKPIYELKQVLCVKG